MNGNVCFYFYEQTKSHKFCSWNPVEAQAERREKEQADMAAPGDAQDGEVVKVELRRRDTSQGWGFRMRGGAQVNMPLSIEAVSEPFLFPKSSKSEEMSWGWLSFLFDVVASKCTCWSRMWTEKFHSLWEELGTRSQGKNAGLKVRLMRAKQTRPLSACFENCQFCREIFCWSHRIESQTWPQPFFNPNTFGVNTRVKEFDRS